VHLDGRYVSAASAACAYAISAYPQRYVSFARSNAKNTPEYSPGAAPDPGEAGPNLNQMLAAGLGGTFGWTADPGSPPCSGPPMMRDCALLAIEGTHASGKTSLTHALAALYRERGIHVATVEEPARRSPFIEKIVVHRRGRFDLETEADLFGALLSAQLRAARQHTMIICNKTIANVLAYAWLVLPAPAGSRPGRDGSVLPRLGPVYDIVFYCCHNYTQEQVGGPTAPKSRTCNLRPTATPSSWRP